MKDAYWLLQEIRCSDIMEGDSLYNSGDSSLTSMLRFSSPALDALYVQMLVEASSLRNMLALVLLVLVEISLTTLAVVSDVTPYLFAFPLVTTLMGFMVFKIYRHSRIRLDVMLTMLVCGVTISLHATYALAIVKMVPDQSLRNHPDIFYGAFPDGVLKIDTTIPAHSFAEVGIESMLLEMTCFTALGIISSVLVLRTRFSVALGGVMVILASHWGWMGGAGCFSYRAAALELVWACVCLGSLYERELGEMIVFYQMYKGLATGSRNWTQRSQPGGSKRSVGGDSGAATSANGDDNSGSRSTLMGMQNRVVQLTGPMSGIRKKLSVMSGRGDDDDDAGSLQLLSSSPFERVILELEALAHDMGGEAEDTATAHKHHQRGSLPDMSAARRGGPGKRRVSHGHTPEDFLHEYEHQQQRQLQRRGGSGRGGGGMSMGVRRLRKVINHLTKANDEHVQQSAASLDAVSTSMGDVGVGSSSLGLPPSSAAVALLHGVQAMAPDLPAMTDNDLEDVMSFLGGGDMGIVSHQVLPDPAEAEQEQELEQRREMAGGGGGDGVAGTSPGEGGGGAGGPVGSKRRSRGLFTTIESSIAEGQNESGSGGDVVGSGSGACGSESGSGTGGGGEGGGVTKVNRRSRGVEVDGPKALGTKNDPRNQPQPTQQGGGGGSIKSPVDRDGDGGQVDTGEEAHQYLQVPTVGMRVRVVSEGESVLEDNSATWGHSGNRGGRKGGGGGGGSGRGLGKGGLGLAARSAGNLGVLNTPSPQLRTGLHRVGTSSNVIYGRINPLKARRSSLRYNVKRMMKHQSEGVAETGKGKRFEVQMSKTWGGGGGGDGGSRKQSGGGSTSGQKGRAKEESEEEHWDRKDSVSSELARRMSAQNSSNRRGGGGGDDEDEYEFGDIAEMFTDSFTSEDSEEGQGGGDGGQEELDHYLREVVEVEEDGSSWGGSTLGSSTRRRTTRSPIPSSAQHGSGTLSASPPVIVSNPGSPVTANNAHSIMSPSLSTPRVSGPEATLTPDFDSAPTLAPSPAAAPTTSPDSSSVFSPPPLNLDRVDNMATNPVPSESASSVRGPLTPTIIMHEVLAEATTPQSEGGEKQQQGEVGGGVGAGGGGGDGDTLKDQDLTSKRYRASRNSVASRVSLDTSTDMDVSFFDLDAYVVASSYSPNTSPVAPIRSPAGTRRGPSATGASPNSIPIPSPISDASASAESLQRMEQGLHSESIDTTLLNNSLNTASPNHTTSTTPALTSSLSSHPPTNPTHTTTNVNVNTNSDSNTNSTSNISSNAKASTNSSTLPNPRPKPKRMRAGYRSASNDDSRAYIALGRVPDVGESESGVNGDVDGVGVGVGVGVGDCVVVGSGTGSVEGTEGMEGTLSGEGTGSVEGTVIGSGKVRRWDPLAGCESVSDPLQLTVIQSTGTGNSNDGNGGGDVDGKAHDGSLLKSQTQGQAPGQGQAHGQGQGQEQAKSPAHRTGKKKLLGRAATMDTEFSASPRTSTSTRTTTGGREARSYKKRRRHRPGGRGISDPHTETGLGRVKSRRKLGRYQYLSSRLDVAGMKRQCGEGVEEVRVMLRELGWGSDLMRLNRLSNRNALLLSGLTYFEKRGLLSRWDLPVDRFSTFLKHMQAGYDLHKNPYHNSSHAADVLNSMHHYLFGLGAYRFVPSLHVLAALIAAICHDYKHPGTNQAFHVAVQSPLAIAYNDDAVLERYHAAQTFALLADPTAGANFLSVLPLASAREVRKVVIDLVMATDLANHFKYIAKLKAITLSPDQIKSRANTATAAAAKAAAAATEAQALAASTAAAAAVAAVRSSARIKRASQTNGGDSPGGGGGGVEGGGDGSKPVSRSLGTYAGAQPRRSNGSAIFSTSGKRESLASQSQGGQSRRSGGSAIFSTSGKGGGGMFSRASNSQIGKAVTPRVSARVSARGLEVGGEGGGVRIGTGMGTGSGIGTGSGTGAGTSLSVGKQATQQQQQSLVSTSVLRVQQDLMQQLQVGREPGLPPGTSAGALPGSPSSLRGGTAESIVSIRSPGLGAGAGGGGKASGVRKQKIYAADFDSAPDSFNEQQQVGVSSQPSSASASAAGPGPGGVVATGGRGSMRAGELSTQPQDAAAIAAVEAAAAAAKAAAEAAAAAAAAAAEAAEVPAFHCAELDVLTVLEMGIKMADLGHPAQPTANHISWSAAVTAEFFMQGDQERKLGLPVSPLMDRFDFDMTKSQTGFFKFVVLPFYTSLAAFMPAADPLLQGVEANRRHWETKPALPENQEQQEQEQQEKEQDEKMKEEESTVVTKETTTVSGNE